MRTLPMPARDACDVSWSLPKASLPLLHARCCLLALLLVGRCWHTVSSIKRLFVGAGNATKDRLLNGTRRADLSCSLCTLGSVHPPTLFAPSQQHSQ